MKSIVFDRHGPPAEVLELRDMPKPTPARGEVLVRMIASPINPSDLLYIEGQYGLKPQFPATPGFEGVGVVEATGGGLLGWLRKGKRVAVVNDRIGNWQEYTVTKARQVIPVPDSLSDEQAACFFVNPATAIAMTRHVLAVPPGEWLLQSAAGSALGKMVIRLGKLFGFRTVNVVRRREQVEELKALGADIVIVESDGPIAEQVRKAVGGDGVKYAIDPVSGPTGSEIVASLAPGGRYLLFGALSAQALAIDPRQLITGSKRMEGFWLGDWAKKQSIPSLLKLFKQVRALIADGTLATEFAGTFTIDQIATAVTLAAKPGKGGKVLLRIGG